MTALLFTLGIIVLCIVLLVFTVHHMVDTLVKLYDDVLDDRLGNYGVNKACKKSVSTADRYCEAIEESKRLVDKANERYKEDTNDSDRT